jgi:short-subunit dehydrogenase
MNAKLALVTGASSGIGEALARRYGASGARVLLLARNPERLDAVADAIRRAGGTASAYPVDLSDPRAVAEVSARIAREAGTPDILINNAGAGRWLTLLETNAEEAQAMIAVPYLAAFNLTRAFLPQMLARRSGAIGCVTSPASYLAWPNACAYIAARHALAGFTAALRSEVKGNGVSVTLIVLGAVASPYWEHNPGSREHLPIVNPALLPTLSTEAAAEAVFTGVAQGKRMVAKPAIFRALFLLNALAPGLVARQLRRQARKQPG